MKVKVLQTFRDINNFDLVHNVGDVIDVTGERAAKLIGLGLAEKEKGKAEEKEPEKAEAPADFFTSQTPDDTPKNSRKRNKE